MLDDGSQDETEDETARRSRMERHGTAEDTEDQHSRGSTSATSIHRRPTGNPPREAEGQIKEVIQNEGARATIRVSVTGFEIMTRSTLSDQQFRGLNGLEIVDSYRVRGDQEGLFIWGEWADDAG